MNIGNKGIQRAKASSRANRAGGLIALLTLLLLTGPMTGWAQSEGAATDQPPPAEQSESEKKDTPPTTAESDVEKSNSPFDYESSEEISEDLSVSFPVDI